MSNRISLLVNVSELIVIRPSDPIAVRTLLRLLGNNDEVKITRVILNGSDMTQFNLISGALDVLRIVVCTINDPELSRAFKAFEIARCDFILSVVQQEPMMDVKMHRLGQMKDDMNKIANRLIRSTVDTTLTEQPEATE